MIDIVKNLFLFAALTFGVTVEADDCSKWFSKGKAKPGTSDCEIKCGITPTDMGTFDCPQRCEEFCHPSSGSPALVAKNPKEALIVFRLKNKAEHLTDKYFPEGRLNDESDVFWHFLWASLLVKEIGTDRAQRYLDAHEMNPSQPASERAMDLANNRGGILAAQKLKDKGNLNDEQIERAGLEALRKNELVVLEPGLQIPKASK